MWNKDIHYPNMGWKILLKFTLIDRSAGGWGGMRKFLVLIHVSGIPLEFLISNRLGYPFLDKIEPIVKLIEIFNCSLSLGVLPTHSRKQTSETIYRLVVTVVLLKWVGIRGCHKMWNPAWPTWWWSNCS